MNQIVGIVAVSVYMGLECQWSLVRNTVFPLTMFYLAIYQVGKP